VFQVETSLGRVEGHALDQVQPHEIGDVQLNRTTGDEANGPYDAR
jgi:hypothetical protein